MRKINLTDITIRESAKRTAVSLTFKEKIEMAKIMDKLNYSTKSMLLSVSFEPTLKLYSVCSPLTYK